MFPYFNSGLLLQFLMNIFIQFFVCHLCIITKKQQTKDLRPLHPFFWHAGFCGMYMACFNEVLLLAFVHYSFTSVSICQNLLIEFGKLSESEDLLFDKFLPQFFLRTCSQNSVMESQVEVIWHPIVKRCCFNKSHLREIMTSLAARMPNSFGF